MKDLKAIDEVLADLVRQLGPVSESPRLDGELLIARAIDMPRSYLFAHPDDTLDLSAQQRLDETLKRRLDGEPMAYITGIKEFWSLEFMVTPATLVPRPETERLVEIALREIPQEAAWPVLDLGTGSGAVAIAIASDRPLCHVIAVDVSPDALAVARQNVRQLAISNVEFREGNWTEPVAGEKYKVIASNPPYVAADDTAMEALRTEPAIALTAGDDGLESIRILAQDCAEIIEDDGLLVLEHGAEQRDAVTEILMSYGWASIRCYDDVAGHPRVTSAHCPSSETS